jgi:hypothetical protein
MDELEKAKKDIAALLARVKHLESNNSTPTDDNNSNDQVVTLNNHKARSHTRDNAHTQSPPQQTQPINRNRSTPQQAQINTTTPNSTPLGTPYGTPLLTPVARQTTVARQTNDNVRSIDVTNGVLQQNNTTETNQDQLAAYYQQLHYIHPHLMHPHYMLPYMQQYRAMPAQQSTTPPINALFGHNNHLVSNSLLFGYHSNTSVDTSRDNPNLSNQSIEKRKTGETDMETNVISHPGTTPKSDIEINSSVIGSTQDNNNILTNEFNFGRVGQSLFQPHLQNINSNSLNTQQNFSTPNQGPNQIVQGSINGPNIQPKFTTPILLPPNGQNNDKIIEKNTAQVMKTGGNETQDTNIMKFTATLIFKKDLDRTKWESKSEIMNQIIKNFKLSNKKLAGPITVFLKNTREIVIKGERESDYLLFENSNNTWVTSAFDKVGIHKCEIEKKYDDNPENMLIGYTYDKMSPEGAKWLKKESKINKIRHRGGNKYDLRFDTNMAREEAKSTGYVQGGGIVLKLGDWAKQINTYQCDKCAKWGHKLNECGNKKQVCKYCADVDVHATSDCPYLNIPEEHKCCNCKNELGHNSTERLECPAFLDFYKKQCMREGIVMEKKYIVAEEKIELRKKEEIENKKLKFDNQLKIINQKLADQLRLNKEMLTNDDVNVADYTRHCENYIDPDVLNEYKRVGGKRK